VIRQKKESPLGPVFLDKASHHLPTSVPSSPKHIRLFDIFASMIEDGVRFNNQDVRNEWELAREKLGSDLEICVIDGHDFWPVHSPSTEPHPKPPLSRPSLTL
jgi:hypothetical protein